MMKCQYIFRNFDENKNLHMDDCEQPGMAARGVPDKRGPVHIPSCASNPHTNSRTGGWISRKVLAHGMAYTAAACKIAGRTSHECADRCKRTRPGKAQAFGEDAQPHTKAPAGMGFPPGLSALRHINKKLIFCCSSSPGTRRLVDPR